MKVEEAAVDAEFTGDLDALLEEAYAKDYSEVEETETETEEKAEAPAADDQVVVDETPVEVEVDKSAQKIDELNRKIDALVQHNQKIEEKALAKAIEKLKAERKSGIEFGDIEAVDAADQKIRELEQKSLTESKQPVTVDTIPDFVQQFANENPWFDKDEAMTSFMMRTTKSLVNDEGMALKDAITEANKLVKSRYADKLINPKKKESSPVMKDKPEIKKNGLSMRDLTKEQLSVWETLEGTISKEDFLKQMGE